MLRRMRRPHTWRSLVTERRVLALAAIATLGFVVATVAAGGRNQAKAPAQPNSTPVVRTATTTMVTRLTDTVTVTIGGTTEGVLAAVPGRRTLRYLVVRGDTLWAIAEAHYQDVLAGMRAIKQRNRLRRNKVFADETLVLPRVDRWRR
jgi:nucleoid-associated protein YgaU